MSGDVYNWTSDSRPRRSATVTFTVGDVETRFDVEEPSEDLSKYLLERLMMHLERDGGES